MISLNAPNLSDKEVSTVKKTLKGGWVSGGKYINLFEQNLRKYVKANYAVACVNGTSALHLALRLIGAHEKSEIIIPNISFIATANAIIYNNSSPIFLGTDEFFNLDIEVLKKFLKFKTFKKNGFTYNLVTRKKILALVVVHVFGNSANISEIKNICKKNKIFLIEDAAESLGTYFKKNNKKIHTGTFGDIGCISFNANKIITSGGGGMILTNNSKIAERARFLSNQAKKNDYFFSHPEIGYNFRLPNVNCAIGYEQLKKIDRFLKIKKRNFDYYVKFLDKKKIEVIKPPKYSLSNFWMCVVRFKVKKNLLNKAIKYLEKNKIQTRPVWKLLNEQQKFKNFQNFDTQKSKKNIFNCLCIPSSTNLKLEQIRFISAKLNIFIKNNS